MDMDQSFSRKRTKTACETCRRSKRKCDGLRPRCTLCQTANKDCHYADEAFTRKRKYWDEDYVKNLEEQIQSLQSVLPDQGISESPTSLQQPIFQASYSHQHFDPQSLKAFGNGQDADDVDLPAPNQPNIPINGETRTTNWTQERGDRVESSFYRRTRHLASSDEALGPNRPESLDPLQDVALTQKLTEVFLNHLNPIYQTVDAEARESIFETGAGKHVDQLLRYAICAAGACFSSLPNTEIVAHTILRYVEKKVLSACRIEPGLRLLQGLIILAWCEKTLDEEAIGWTYSHMAAGMVLQLGLNHLDPVHDKLESSMSALRVRVFWSWFMFDRQTGTAQGRYSLITPERIRTPSYASVMDTTTMDLDELVFHYHSQLWYLNEQTLAQIDVQNTEEMPSKERDQLLLDVREAHAAFFTSVDERLKPSDLSQAEKSVLVFHLSYHTALLGIYRPFARKSTNKSFQSAVQAMTAAANTISQLLLQFRNRHNFADTVPMVMNHISKAAIMHLMNATSSRATLRNRSASGLNVCIEALEEASHRFEAQGRKALQMIRELAQHWRVVHALPAGFMAKHLVIDQSLGSGHHVGHHALAVTHGTVVNTTEQNWMSALDPQLHEASGLNTLDPQLQGNTTLATIDPKLQRNTACGVLDPQMYSDTTSDVLDPQLHGDANPNTRVPSGVNLASTDEDFFEQWTDLSIFEKPNVLDSIAWPLANQVWDSST